MVVRPAVRPSIRKTAAWLNNYGLSTDGRMVEKVVSVTMRLKAAGDEGGGGEGREQSRRERKMSQNEPE